MKLNNKGFALSTTLYVILILAVVLITLTLSILSNRKIILDRQREEASDVIYLVNTTSCREVLSVLKSEAIDYLSSRGLNSGEVAVKNLNSSVYEAILNRYKLSDKLISIKYENSEYSASLVNRLPQAYQEVEYIESPGTQYIDTGIKLPLVVEVKAKYNSFPTTQSSNAAILGNQNKNSPWNSTFVRYAFNAKAFEAKCSNTKINSSKITSDLNIHTFKLICFQNNGEVYIDGESKGIINSTSNLINYNIYLFATNSQGTADHYMNGRIYYVKFYSDVDGTNLIRNFVPCYHKQSGDIGLYDIANGKFYTSSGTGTLTAGENVLDNGSWQIDIP